MSVANAFIIERQSPAMRARTAIQGDIQLPDTSNVIFFAVPADKVETQPGNTGVPDPEQVTANPALPSPVPNALTPAGAVTAAANPASLANSVAALFSNVTSAVPQVGSLNGIYFAALLYLAWHLYSHHHHYKLALAVVGLDVYLAYFRTIAPAAVTQ